MSRKNSVIFIIAMVFLIPLFGWGIWKEINSEDNDFQKKLDGNIPKNSASSKSVSSEVAKKPSSASELSQNPTASNVENESSQAEKPPENPENQKESEKPKDETEAWSVYQNKKDSFEFKYPPEASVADSGSFVTISQGDKSWRIRVYDDKNKEELGAWFNSYFEEKERKNCVLGDSTVKIGSYETKYANLNSGGTTCDQDGYYAINTEKTKIVKVKIGKETVENVNKILATFKFINQ